MKHFLFQISKKLFICAFVPLFFFSSATCASASDELKFAYVDMQRALQESKAGKSAQKSYENEVSSAQKTIDKKKKEFEKKRKSFEKQRESLNEKALSEKQEELLSIEREVKRSFQDSQAKLRRKNSTIVSELIKELRKTVETIGVESKYTMIFEKGSQALLYAPDSIDITDRVIVEFNKQTKGKKF